MNDIQALMRFVGGEVCRDFSILKVKVRRLHPDAVLPSKAHPTDAGFDLTCIGDLEYDDCGNLVYRTGLSFEIPEGYAGFIFPRSSVAKKDLILTNCVGIIDSGFRGEVLAKFKPLIPITSAHDAIYAYRKGERFAQMVILPYPEVVFDEVDNLAESDRGEGGYGSSGK